MLQSPSRINGLPGKRVDAKRAGIMPKTLNFMKYLSQKYENNQTINHQIQ